MKTTFVILLFVFLTGFTEATFAQTCDCIPSIPTECIRPCFIKKINKFTVSEIKTMLDDVTTVSLNDSVKLHNRQLSEMLINYIKANKNLDMILDHKDKVSVDKVLESTKFATKLESK